MDLLDLKAKLAAVPTVRPVGKVTKVTGLALHFTMPGVRIGDIVDVDRRGDALPCEVVGFDGGHAVAMALGEIVEVGPEDPVVGTGGGLRVHASEALLGRVVDGLGRPVDEALARMPKIEEAPRAGRGRARTV